MWVYVLAFFLLIVAFTLFYVSNGETEVADDMKDHGGFIPGIGPGRPNTEYLGYVPPAHHSRSMHLGAVALFPLVGLAAIGVGNQFPSAA